MEFAVISNEEALIQIEELSEPVRGKLGDDTVVFAALDENSNVLSSAVYSCRKARRGEAELLWLYTIPEARLLGAAAGVLSFGESQLFSQGIRTIQVKIQEPMELAVSLYYFLIHAGYQPVSLGYHMMQYDVSSVTGCLRIQKFARDPELVLVPTDAERLGYLLRENPDIPRTERDRLRFLADPRYSLFYGQGGRLTACVPVRRENAEIRVMELYVGPEITRKTARLTMLAQLAMQVSEYEEKPDRILFEVEDVRLCSLYRGLFGMEKQDVRMQKYVRHLRGEKNDARK